MFRVFIVENNEVYSKLIQDLIVSEYAFIDTRIISSAHDVPKAIELLVPDVVILSIHITGVNGLELVKLIKSINSGTQVIVISNFSMEEYEKSSLDAGADYFFCKDSAAFELLEVIDKLLPVEDQRKFDNSLLLNRSDKRQSGIK